ncbi:MAG: VWA domain-containing protein [Dermatophilaceae bacterium]
MSFAWPWLLLGLLAVPALVLGYRRLLRRGEARRAQLSATGLVPAGTAYRGRRRHLAPALVLAALTLLIIGMARPEATIADPRREGTVVLAFDVSTSMAAKDMSPTRLEAAKAAARRFVEHQPTSIRIGVVAFGDSGLITQAPTSTQADVFAAIDRLTPQGGTALGRGIQTSLSAIVGKTVQLDESGGLEADGQNLGYFGSAAVILLSDGENTVKPDPVDVAELASAAGVKIYPIGLGSPQGTVLEVDGFQIATALDEPLLRKVADTTGGQYFSASDEQGLAAVYDSIDLQWTAEPKQVEITALLAGAAALLLLVGATLSVLRFGRVM